MSPTPTLGSLKIRRSRGGLNVRATGDVAGQMAAALGGVMAAGARRRTLVQFVDQGQDVLRWLLDPQGVVVKCEPFHADLYVGVRVLGLPMPGEQIRFASQLDGQAKTLRWPVESVELLP